MSVHISVDLGAESGRVIRGDLVEDRLEVREAARFPTAPARAGGRVGARR